MTTVLSTMNFLPLVHVYFFRYTQWYILHFRQRDFKVEETRPALTIQNFIICVKVLFMVIYNLSFVLFMVI